MCRSCFVLLPPLALVFECLGWNHGPTYPHQTKPTTTDAGAGADSELPRGPDAAARADADAGARRSDAGDAAGRHGPTAGPAIQWVETARRLETRRHQPSMSPCPNTLWCPRYHFPSRGHPDRGTRTPTPCGQIFGFLFNKYVLLT